GGKPMRSNRPSLIAAFAALALVMLAPTGAAQAAAAQENANTRPWMLTEAYNATGRMLFRQLSAGPGNIVLSPFSIGSDGRPTLNQSPACGAAHGEVLSARRGAS